MTASLRQMRHDLKRALLDNATAAENLRRIQEQLRDKEAQRVHSHHDENGRSSHDGWDSWNGAHEGRPHPLRSRSNNNASKELEP